MLVTSVTKTVYCRSRSSGKGLKALSGGCVRGIRCIRSIPGLTNDLFSVQYLFILVSTPPKSDAVADSLYFQLRYAAPLGYAVQLFCTFFTRYACPRSDPRSFLSFAIGLDVSDVCARDTRP